MFDLGLLIVRVIVGGLLAAHGLQKLTGWFGGPGIDGNAGYLRSLGYRRPRWLAWVHGGTETAAGLLLASGLLTPLAVAGVIGVMLNAAVVAHAGNGLWVQEGGYEYPLVLSTLACALVLTGPGRFALDELLGWQPTAWWAMTAIGLGILAGLGALAAREPVDRASATPSDDARRPLAA